MNNSIIHCFDFNEEQTKYGLILISENNNIDAKSLHCFVGGYIYYPEDGSKLYDMVNLNVILLQSLILTLDDNKDYWEKYLSFYSALMQSAQNLINKECAYVIVTADGIKLQTAMVGNNE